MEKIITNSSGADESSSIMEYEEFDLNPNNNDNIDIDDIKIEDSNNNNPKIITFNEKNEKKITLPISETKRTKTYNGKQKKRIEDIISYLKVQKQPFHDSELSKIYDMLDVDGDEKITSEEIKRFLNTLKSPVNDFYIQKIIRDFDSNKDGDIQKKEFLERMKSQSDKGYGNELTELLEIFKLFDANHDNKICDQDLRNIMNALGENFDEDTCKEMMKHLSDRTGSISFSKFFDLVKDEGKTEIYN
jgi:Ca2+-binding EF-hand superfamily protein